MAVIRWLIHEFIECWPCGCFMDDRGYSYGCERHSQ